MLVVITVALAVMASAVNALAASSVGVVWFGRPNLADSEYAPLFDAMVHEVPNTTVVVAGADPVQAVHQLRINHNITKLLVASHSMEPEAGVAAQAFVAQQASTLHIDGLVLIAGFLQRIYRPDLVACADLAKIKPTRSVKHPGGLLEDGVHDCSKLPAAVSFPVPVLTIGGELDGVVRVGRLTEAWYSQQKYTNLPVVVVQGMSHSSILANATVTGDVPAALTETSAQEARTEVARCYGAFVRGDDLSGRLDATEALLTPLLHAFVEQEHSWWFTSGTDEEHGASSFSAMAQQYMADPLPQGWRWAHSTNAFHMLSDEDRIPPYFRDKHRADVEIVSVQDKTLSSSTVAQLRYVKVTVAETDIGLNGFAIIREEKAEVLASGGFLTDDDGKAYVSAIEIGTKLASRQLVFNKTSEVEHGPDAPETLDDGNRCAAINRLSYQWALAAASPAARARHEQHGMKMRMVDDMKPNPPAGPWWIWNYLQYTPSTDSVDGRPVLDISSWYAFYATSGLAYGAGNHYCKVLSPARAMEWIYTDSLKQ